MKRLLHSGLLWLSASPALAQDGAISIEGGRIADPAPDASGVRRYLGIPYAAPPIGPLRWLPPAAVVPWPGVRPTDAFGADCFQPLRKPVAGGPRWKGAEDCLYLNVWTPTIEGAKPGGKAPVFVWIHGGSSQVGSGSQPEFDGAALARKGIVVVTINYRLGPLGFLSTSALSAESSVRASGNQGFLDDIAALRWVRRNIAAFGGDPARVTIGGESAGSVAGSVLMASPMAKGLFHRVIGESGSAFRIAERGSMGADALATEEAKGNRLAETLGARDLAQMRALPPEALLEAEARMGVTFNIPVVDGHVLPDKPWSLFAQRRHSDVPLLAGWNADEGLLLLIRPLRPLVEVLRSRYGAQAERLAPFYTGEDRAAALKAEGDHGIAYWTWLWATAQLRYGRAPVYLYEFDRVPPVAFDPATGRAPPMQDGAFHGGEIPYVFDTLDAMPGWRVTPEDRRLAATMSDYWANFIRSGNPHGSGLPAWPRHTAKAPGLLRIGLDTRATIDPSQARFEAIEAARQALSARSAPDR